VSSIIYDFFLFYIRLFALGIDAAKMKQLDESEDPADEVALDARFASLNSKKFRFEISVSKTSCLADTRQLSTVRKHCRHSSLSELSATIKCSSF
jgi:hypothetical protein